MGVRINESHSWAGDELSSGTVANVVDEGLTVGSDKDSDRTVDTTGHDAVVEWQRDGSKLATKQHLAEEFLKLGEKYINCVVDIGLKRIYRSIVRARDCTGGKG